MKKKLSLILALLLVLSLALSACNNASESVDYVLASEIGDDVKAEADAVLSGFMQAFEENNPAAALPLFSSEFEANEEDLAAFFEEVQKLVDAPFVPYDSYYMKGLTVEEALLKVKKSADATEYIEIAPAAEELYCAMYVSDSKNISRMMTILLARENGEFKITWVAPTDFKYDGVAAPEVYNRTKTLSDEGKLFSAYISSCKLGKIMRPGSFFRYSNDLEMEDLCNSLVDKISTSYPLPLALAETTESSVYEISLANDAELGLIPLIFYKTDATITNESALRAESEKVLAALEKIFPDIRESSEVIRFEATNDVIDENTTSINKKSINLKV